MPEHNAESLTRKESLPCYRIECEGGDAYYGIVFPEPNQRAALWGDDGVGGVTVCDDLDAALDTVGATACVPATVQKVRPFVMRRYHDVSGRSGTGYPAVGIEFPDGVCVMGWLTDINSVSVYDCLDEVQNIHGHGGSTQVRYVTEDGQLA